MADEVSGLGRAKVESSFRSEAGLGSLFNSAETVSQFHVSLGCEVNQRIREVGVQAKRGDLFIGNDQDKLTGCHCFLQDAWQIWVITE